MTMEMMNRVDKHDDNAHDAERAHADDNEHDVKYYNDNDDRHDDEHDD